MADAEPGVLRLHAPPGAPTDFRAGVAASGTLRLTLGEGEGPEIDYGLGSRSHVDYIELFDRLASDWALRRPLARIAPPARGGQAELTPLLTEPLAPGILYGYGDPCVVRVGPSDYRLLVTSNDAPDAFPTLASRDLVEWRHTGFVFPRGHAPAWATTIPGISDFWAPELHRVEGEWWVCFSARTHDRTMAVGLARGVSPDGPFVADPQPLVGGDAIDAHILVDEEGAPWLIWKKDDNGVWPGLLAGLLCAAPWMAERLFDEAPDRRTAGLAMTLWPWTRTLEPMEQFFILQTLVEAVAADVPGFMERLRRLAAAPEGSAHADVLRRIADTLRTRIYAQRLRRDGRALLGAPQVILQNDLPWEGHLIEGVWVTRVEGRYYLLYAGNDFSTSYYGIGGAIAERPNGPYVKLPDVLLASTDRWWGPGHPSVATLDDGRYQVFLHGYRPGEAGYKVFRALLTAPLRMDGGDLAIG